MNREAYQPNSTSRVVPRQRDLLDVSEGCFQLAARLLKIDDASSAECAKLCRRALDKFETDGRKEGYDPTDLLAARSGLEVVLNSAVRRNKSIDPVTWQSVARGGLFKSRDNSIARLREMISLAGRHGKQSKQVHAFLTQCHHRCAGAQRDDKSSSCQGLKFALVFATLAIGGILAWAIWSEWRLQSEQLSGFQSVRNVNMPFLSDSLPEAVRKLDKIRVAAALAKEEPGKFSVGIVSALGIRDVVKEIDKDYAASVEKAFRQHVPNVLNLAIATEGDELRLYDNIRMLAVLTGQTDWEPAFVAGWLKDRAIDQPGFSGLAKHVDAIYPFQLDMAQYDPIVVEQAIDLAKSSSEAERAFLELKRLDSIQALEPWVLPDAVPFAGDVFIRGSGRAISDPIPGLYTSAGWDHVRDYASGTGITKAREMSAALFEDLPVRDLDPARGLLRLLQQETNQSWLAFLMDLRVRPFEDRETALLVSSRLAKKDSPLDRIIESLWTETGGTDPRRSSENQIALATTFGLLIRYAEREQIADVRRLFSDLNFAILTEQSTANLATRASSEKILTFAPAVIRQIVDDVISQSVVIHQDASIGPVIREWRATVGIRCQQLIENRYPFGDGPDARIADVQDIFGSDGLVRDFTNRLEHLIDKSGEIWRWTAEARLAGLHPRSVRFLQDTEVLSDALFPDDNDVGQPIKFTTVAQNVPPRAELGRQQAALGIEKAPVVLHWPGPDPASGFKIMFDTEAKQNGLSEAGPWGFFRIAERTRWRPRDEGRRFLWYLSDSGNSVVLALDFNGTPNLLSEWQRFRGLQCPRTL